MSNFICFLYIAYSTIGIIYNTLTKRVLCILPSDFWHFTKYWIIHIVGNSYTYYAPRRHYNIEFSAYFHFISTCLFRRFRDLLRLTFIEYRTYTQLL
jgi:hypothetical protein